MNWVSIGPITVPASWVAMVMAFLITEVLLFISKKKTVSDWYGNAIFIFIMTWKLSVVIFQFKMAIANPMTILYFNGGAKGYWLGIAGAMIYTIYMKRRLAPETFINLLLTWIMTVSIYELVAGVLNEGAIWLILLQVVINLVFLLLLIFKKGKFQWQLQLLILFTCIQGLVYSLKDDFFSVPIATYGLFAIFFGLWSLKRRDNQ